MGSSTQPRTLTPTQKAKLQAKLSPAAIAKAARCLYRVSGLYAEIEAIDARGGLVERLSFVPLNSL